jgi:deoxyribonuclease-4
MYTLATKGTVPCQIFLRSPRQNCSIKIADIELAKLIQFISETSLRVYVHSPYVLNLCNKDVNLTNLRSELEIAHIIGVKGVVIHVGKQCDYGNIDAVHEFMYNNIVSLYSSINEETPLLLETPSGQGSETLTNVNSFIDFYKRLDNKKVKICVDTCHVFASGYDPIEYMNTLIGSLGREAIILIHLNDSKCEKGSKKDRHELVGQGCIGVTVMADFIDKFKDIDMVTE